MIKLLSLAGVCFLHVFGHFHISHQLIRRRNVFQGVNGYPKKTSSSSERLRKIHLWHFKVPAHRGAR
jgi:hypothetical protein